MKHQRQEKAYWCGNACLAMLLDKSQAEMARLVGTTKSGTSSIEVMRWLDKENIGYHYIQFNTNPTYDQLWWLPRLSQKHALYLSCDIRDKYFIKGRERCRNHAVLAVDGLFYDPSNFQPQPFDVYKSTWNRELYLKSMILFTDERSDYLTYLEE
jgi:hypothetical protein